MALTQDLQFLIESQYGKDAKLEDLLAKGYIRKANGKKFTKQELAEANISQIEAYLAQNVNKLVLYEQISANDPKHPEKMKDKRIGSIRINSESKPVFTPDSPTKDNDYSKAKPDNLEPAEVSPELIDFVEDLISIMDEAGLDTENIGDRARLKGYYIDPNAPEENKLIERDINKNWKFNTKDGLHEYGSDSALISEEELDERDNELYLNTVSLRRTLDELKHNTAGQPKLHQLYSVMELTKNGGLMLTKRGELIKDSHPVIFGDNGKLKLAPSYKDADEKEKQTAPYLLIKDHISKSPKAEDKEYSDYLDVQHDRIFIQRYYSVFKQSMEQITESLYTDSKAKGLDKTEYMKQIMEMPRYTKSNFTDLYNQQLDESGSESRINPRTIKSSEAAKRDALSKQAQFNYFSSYYDFQDTIPFYREEAEKSGIDMNAFNGLAKANRDRFYVLMSPGRDEATINKNLYRLSLLTGQGLDLSQPGAKDMKDRMYAQAINEVAKEIAEFDYEKYIRLSDEELVKKWPEIQAPFSRLVVAKEEIETILQQDRKNKYIDKTIMQAALDVENKLMAYSYVNTMRIRAIMNPYYAKFPTEFINTAKPDQIVSDAPTDSSDAYMSRFSKAFCEIPQSWQMAISQEVRYEYAKKFGLNCSAEDIRFYDAEGNELSNNDAVIRGQKLKDGEFILISYDKEPGMLTAVSMDKKTGRIKLNPELFSKKESKIQSTISNLNDKFQKNKDDNTCYSLNSLYYNQKGYDESYEEVVREINSKSLSLKEINSRLKEHFDNEPEVSREEFCSASGMDSESMPDYEELMDRRTLSVKAQQAMLDLSLKQVEALSLPMSQKNGWNERVYRYALYKTVPVDKTFNQRLENALGGSSLEDQKKIIEERFRAYLDQEALFDKAYTDAELVENWATLRSVSLGMGMEYIELMRNIQEHGIIIDPDLKKKMDLMHEKVNAFGDYYTPKMNMIGSKYYQYGIENISFDKAAELYTAQDKELAKAAGAAFTFMNQRQLSLGQHACLKAFPGERDVIKAVVDEEGIAYSPHNINEIGKLIQNGKKLFFIHSGNDEVKQFSYNNLNGFPPEAEEIPLDMTPRERRIMSYKAGIGLMKSLNNVQLSASEKKVEGIIWAANHEMQLLLKKPEAEFDEAEYKENLADYLTGVAIKNSYDGKGYDNETLEILTSNENIAQFKQDMIRYDFVNSVYAELTKDGAKLSELTPEKINETLAKVRDDYSKNKAKEIEAKELAELKKRESQKDKESFEKISKIGQVYNGGLDELDIKNFIEEKDMEDFKTLRNNTKLTKMSLSRKAVQALAIAMMINQGISMDQIFTDEMKDIRKTCGRAAMDAIKANDVEVIRTNYLRALNTTNDYVEAGLGGLKNLSISEFLTSENKGLYIASMIRKDFSQEFNSCQYYLKKEEKVPEKICGDIMTRAESLGHLTSRLLDGVANPKDRGFNSLSNAFTNYVTAYAVTKYMKSVHEIPENKGKTISQTLDEDIIGKSYIIYGEAIEQSHLDVQKMDQKTRDTLLSMIMDDTLKDYMDLRVVTSPEGDFKVKLNVPVLMERIKFRNAPQELKEVIPPMSEAEQKTFDNKNKIIDGPSKLI